MGSNFEVIYPPKGNKITFDGGFNNKFSKQLILDNESPDCLNVVFGNRSVQTRGGTDKFNTTSVGTFVNHGLYTRHDNSGAETMVAWYNGTLYYASGTAFAEVASAVSIYTAGVRVTAAEYENYMFFGNGSSTPYKYNGAHFTRHGIPQPTSAATVATDSTGVLSGTYQYKVAYVNSALVAGDVNTATDAITFAGEKALISSIPVAPTSFGVNSRYLYRTLASGVVFYYLDEIADNTTTTYADNTPDSSLGSVAPTDQGEPPNYSYLLFHQARLFGVDPSDNLVKYSELGNPYVWKATNFRRIGDTTFDIPTGLSVYDNSIYVYCKSSIWLIYMESTDDTTWRDIRVRSSYGSNSPFMPFLYNNRVMFAATEGGEFVGFGALSGASMDPSASLLTASVVNSDLQSNMIEPDMRNIPNASISKISGIVFKNKAYIAVTYGAGETANNRLYHFDFSMENLRKSQKFMWSPWSGIEPEQFTICGNNLYFATSNDSGHVYQMLTDTYNDDGSAINSYYWTKEYDLGAPNWQKDFRWLNLLYGLFGDYFMNITIKVDSDKGSGTTEQIYVDQGGTNWLAFNWGDDIWDAGKDDKQVKRSLGRYKGKRIQFKFDNQNTVNQAFKVIEMDITFNLRGKR